MFGLIFRRGEESSKFPPKSGFCFSKLGDLEGRKGKMCYYNFN
jgi:hypothetical protein